MSEFRTFIEDNLVALLAADAGAKSLRSEFADHFKAASAADISHAFGALEKTFKKGEYDDLLEAQLPKLAIQNLITALGFIKGRQGKFAVEIGLCMKKLPSKSLGKFFEKLEKSVVKSEPFFDCMRELLIDAEGKKLELLLSKLPSPRERSPEMHRALFIRLITASGGDFDLMHTTIQADLKEFRGFEITDEKLEKSLSNYKKLTLEQRRVFIKYYVETAVRQDCSYRHDSKNKELIELLSECDTPKLYKETLLGILSEYDRINKFLNPTDKEAVNFDFNAALRGTGFYDLGLVQELVAAFSKQETIEEHDHYRGFPSTSAQVVDWCINFIPSPTAEVLAAFMPIIDKLPKAKQWFEVVISLTAADGSWQKDELFGDAKPKKLNTAVLGQLIKTKPEWFKQDLLRSLQVRFQEESGEELAASLEVAKPIIELGYLDKTLAKLIKTKPAEDLAILKQAAKPRIDARIDVVVNALTQSIQIRTDNLKTLEQQAEQATRKAAEAAAAVKLATSSLEKAIATLGGGGEGKCRIADKARNK